MLSYNKTLLEQKATLNEILLSLLWINLKWWIIYFQFQVIVMNANMGCAQCRQRVTQVTSKIKGEEFNPVNYILT